MNDQSQQANQLLHMLSKQIDGTSTMAVEDKNHQHIPEVQQKQVIPETQIKQNDNVVTTDSIATPANVIPESKVVDTDVNGTQPAASTPAQPTTAVDTSILEKMLLDVVSEKTGYPAEMLEMGMDMEADLGIDSIKRVEIFGALTKQYPDMADINPNELTELRTLGEIVDYVGPKGASVASTTTVPAPAAKVQEEVVSVTAPVQVTTAVTDNSLLEKMLLDVVSEKTGYPAEMLELSMDMEADLGIDSIKRVEIFGALTKQYPDMADINPNELTELRTLGEIVDYVGQKGGVEVTNNTAVAEPVAVKEEVLPVTPQMPETNNTTDNGQLENMLLEVVSEKTGYPSEMLEMSMDMEADLGIDSIKRVEIFGALTKQYPDMSDINPNELTELRTLGEIVSYVGEASKKKVLA